MRRHKPHAGFSLLELTVSIAVLLIISGATFSALNFSQKAYASQQLQADVHAGLRGTFALLAQEVGQAGSLNFIPQTLSAAVTGGTVAQTVQLSSTANIFVGEELTVDTGSNQELVQVISFPGTNQISGIFRQNHALAAPVTAQGVFPNGVLTTTAGNTLQLFGDVNADGSLEYVEYDCNPGSTSAPGTLTRSITAIAPGVTTRTAQQVLLNTLVANPGGTSCFTPSMGVGGAVTAGNCTTGGTAFTCVTDVQVMLTIQTAEKDPQTGTYTTVTKSFLNLSSRNVFAAYAIATASSPSSTFLQPQPPGLPLL